MAVMREAGECPAGIRLRGLIVVLWRAGLRISEALALSEGDLVSSQAAGRFWFAAARAVAVARSAWTSGAGSSFAPGLSIGSHCPSGRSSAW
jgi:hypothetical protein